MQRTYAREDVDPRAPVLVNLISHIVALQRYYGLRPTMLILNQDMYTVVAAYVGGGGRRVDRLFNVQVLANCDEDSIPFVLVTEGKRE